MNIKFNNLHANYFQNIYTAKNEIMQVLQLNDQASMLVQHSIYNTIVLLNLKGITIDPFWIALGFLDLSVDVSLNPDLDLSNMVNTHEVIEIFEETQFDECKFFAFIFCFVCSLTDYCHDNCSILNKFDAKNPLVILKMHAKYPSIIEMISKQTQNTKFLEWIEKMTLKKISLCPEKLTTYVEEKLTTYVEYFKQCRLDINRQKSFLN